MAVAPTSRQAEVHDVRAAVRLRPVHHQLPGRADRLLDHDQPLDLRAAGGGAPDRAAGAGGRGRGERRRRRPWPTAEAAARSPRRRRHHRKKKKRRRTVLRAEGSAGSVAGARWAAMKQLQGEHPEVDPDLVEFETLEEGPEGVRVAAEPEASVGAARSGRRGRSSSAADPGARRRSTDEFEEVGGGRRGGRTDEDDARGGPATCERGRRRGRRRVAGRAGERVREIAGRAGARRARPRRRASTSRRATTRSCVTVSGDDLGLLIGKHGQTIDAVQMVCSQAATAATRSASG